MTTNIENLLLLVETYKLFFFELFMFLVVFNLIKNCCRIYFIHDFSGIGLNNRIGKQLVFQKKNKINNRNTILFFFSHREHFNH